ncbi:CRTAC1 family protein [Haloferula sp.]|uniref:CRTAC1 family protein n=1 Tax=Haloferula sp. TaxID=2497595 RepID=UPI00329C21B4
MCFSPSIALVDAAPEAETHTLALADFVSAGSDFPRSEKNLRKWETPVIADLDQDGWVDMILNEHGFAIQIAWNNKGKYAEPWDLVMGDIHGISIGDYDQDGLLELIVSRGGGSGSNARNSMIYKVGKNREFERLEEFKEPLAMMRGRTVKFFDGDKDGDLDLLNLAFPSREIKGASENYVYENDGKGGLVLNSRLPASKKDGQKILITDFNSDGIDDLLMYGSGPLRAFEGKGDLGFTEVGDAVLGGSIKDATGIVELDFDNDGDFDIYISRGLEMDAGVTFNDVESRTWGFFTKRGKFRFDQIVTGDVLQLENFQSPWPNMKIFTGEPALNHEFPGETHSGKDLSFVNSDTLGWPDQVTEKGLYIGYVGNGKWRLAGESWSPMTGVVRGAEGPTCSEEREGPRDLLLENRDGKFIDVTDEAGLSLNEHTTGVVAADFDNSGFDDLLVIRRGNLVTPNASVLWLNQGGGTFKRVERHGIVSPELGAIGMGVEAFDYNLDGKLDALLGNERGKWHLFRNKESAKGSYLTVDLGLPAAGQATRLGATVTVTACAKTQCKRSGSGGAPYSRSFNRYVHFGLGECRGPVTVEVNLSNGERFKKQVDTVNRVVTIDN